MREGLSFTNNTGTKMPSIPLGLLKKDILGEKYVLSVALVSKKTSESLNNTYRKKNYPTNVLSFPLGKDLGELVLCPEIIKKEAKEKKFGKNFRELYGFLVIHGMLHLKGMRHGSIMEEAEHKYDKKYFYRDRSGVLKHEGRGGRVSKRRKRS